jgi:hypothetical protein
VEFHNIQWSNPDMPRGGARPGAGRPKGTVVEIAARRLRRELEGDLERFSSDTRALFFNDWRDDPVDFLVLVARTKELPLQLRVEAAKAAAPYIKPRLSSTKVEIKSPEHLTDDELAGLLATAKREADEDDATRH